MRVLKDVLDELKLKFRKKDIDTFLLDAQLIIMDVMDISRAQLLASSDMKISEEQYDKISAMAQLRLKYMPMQYILGHCEFMGIEFYVNEHTLIPRGDTEILVEQAIATINYSGFNYGPQETNAGTNVAGYDFFARKICSDFGLQDENKCSVLDIGTGSGAIAVSIAKYTDAEVTAVDISEKALEIAEKNAEYNNVSVKFIKSDLFENIEGRFDIIVSNPPYIETDVITTLEPQVKDYEPHSALDGGEDGLYFYKKIVQNCHKYLNDGGYLMFEIGYNQGKALVQILENADFSDIEIKKDLAGLDRLVIAKKI